MTTAEMILRGKTDIDEVYEAGKAQRDYEWWDKYQTDLFNHAGDFVRNDYARAFASPCWNDELYNPVRTLYPFVDSTDMYADSSITDTKVPICVADIRAINPSKTFRNSALITIREFIVDELTPMSSQFTNCENLENLTIVGTIATNANFQWCYCLTLESMISVITHLKNFTTDDPGKAFARTVQFDEDCLDNLVENGGLSPNGNSWTDYITDLGWNY